MEKLVFKLGNEEAVGTTSRAAGTFSPVRAGPPAAVRAGERCSLRSKDGLIFTWSSLPPLAGTPSLRRTVAVKCPPGSR